MLNALRNRPLTLTALLLLLAAVSVDLCRHGIEIDGASAAVPATTSFACVDCNDCCDAGSGNEGTHCHVCLCACHALGILDGGSGGLVLPAAAPLAGSFRAQRLAGFHAAFERPPLTS
jgi:hypothetical protein